MLDPLARPEVRLDEMVALLARHEVRWVLTGSAVLSAHGAELIPNDLDVTPALDESNLRRLADALAEVEAIPAYTPDWDFSLEQCLVASLPRDRVQSGPSVRDDPGDARCAAAYLRDL